MRRGTHHSLSAAAWRLLVTSFIALSNNMKLSTIGSLLVQLLLATPSAARLAHVYISEPSTHSDVDVPSLSASTARIVFARRLGLSEFHSLTQEDIDGNAVEALNTYGGQMDGLFGSKSKRASRSMIFVEGYDRPSGMPLDYISAFTSTDTIPDVLPNDILKHALRFSIDSAPSPQENDKLLQDLRTQHAALPEQQYTSAGSKPSELKIESLAKDDAGPAVEVKTYLQQLLANDDGMIVVFMDAVHSGSTLKRSSSSWGTYKLAQKRQGDFFSGRPDINAENPADDIEVELVPVDDDFFSFEESVERPWFEDVAIQQEDDDNDDAGSSNKTAPAGILPQCFTSEATCSRTTNDCSGHGSCESKYKYSEGSKTVECFACSCDATVQGEGSTKLTTYWSGPACQKKDISTPFWLLSSITLGLVLVVTWGIGLLYTMGQQELPSVIGAGVAGPRPK